MKINISSIPVADQDDALQFYTEILGFEKKTDFPAGEYRWLTVVSPEEPDATQLALEPNVHPATQAYQAALLADGIPISTFEADDLIAEVARLENLGVKFTTQPVDVGTAMIAVFDDSCGNLIQLYETKSPV